MFVVEEHSRIVNERVYILPIQRYEREECEGSAKDKGNAWIGEAEKSQFIANHPEERAKSSYTLHYVPEHHKNFPMINHLYLIIYIYFKFQAS